MEEIRAFVGLDVHKATIAVAIADPGRSGEVRHLGNIENTPTAIRQAGPSDWQTIHNGGLRLRSGILRLQRPATAYGSGLLMPHLRAVTDTAQTRRPGQKTTGAMQSRWRACIALARLHRAGELTYVWVPDALHVAPRRQLPYDRDAYRGRNLVERLWCRLKD